MIDESASLDELLISGFSLEQSLVLPVSLIVCLYMVQIGGNLNKVVLMLLAEFRVLLQAGSHFDFLALGRDLQERSLLEF